MPNTICSVSQLASCSTLAVGLTLAPGCSTFESIDAKTDALLQATNERLGGNAMLPDAHREEYPQGDAPWYLGNDLFTPDTNNPRASEIEFKPRSVRDAVVEAETEQTLQALDIDPDQTAEALQLDLQDAFVYSLNNSREFKTAEEEYVLAALRLLVERHRWGPRFFDEVSANITGVGDDNNFDTALELVNEFRVTQRLPYGGEVSARMLARATEDLHERVAGENVQTADVIIAADIPLLRGAGLAARESRIQSERNLVYAARAFERFRREFLVDIASDFLDLVVFQNQIANAERQLQSFLDFAKRQDRLVESGRVEAFSAALAAQDVLFAQDDLRSQRENYRLAVDRFKIRIGMPVNEEVEIVRSALGLPTPEVMVEKATRLALNYRLDLQTRRDRLADARRGVDIARNELLPDLNLSGSFNLPTDSDRDRDGLRFDGGESSFIAGVTFGLPLDREIERLNVRQAQIDSVQQERAYEVFRDNIVLAVRDAVRQIDRAIFSIRLQEENIQIAKGRLESIELAPDKATARDRSEAAEALTRAENGLDRAVRDLQVAILQYLLSTGTLRVADDGSLLELNGMELGAGAGGGEIGGGDAGGPGG